MTKKRGRPAGSKNKVNIDWERLARDLQAALKDEISETTKLTNEISSLKVQLDAEKLLTADLTRETNRQRDNMLEMRGIIHYLEGKIENEY